MVILTLKIEQARRSWGTRSEGGMMNVTTTPTYVFNLDNVKSFAECDASDDQCTILPLYHNA